MNKSEKITFRATADLKQKIKQLAKMQGVSTGHLVRNWISVFIENTLLKTHTHYYELADGRQFRNMKVMCDELGMSSQTARKRIKTSVIKKITIDPNHPKKFGNEQIQATRSGRTQETKV